MLGTEEPGLPQNQPRESSGHMHRERASEREREQEIVRNNGSEKGQGIESKRVTKSEHERESMRGPE